MTSGSDRTAGDAVAGYVAARDAVISARRGSGGTDVCFHLTTELDAALAQLYRDTGSPRLAIVAVGGYGRREMCIFSDVDIMLLHDGSLDSSVVPRIFYPLWDAKLTVGHSVRSLREAAQAAKASVETLSSLLTARVVAGDEGLLRRFQREFSGLLSSERRRFSSALAEEEVERRLLEPYHLLAVDIKNGRGGLRTFQAMEWERRRDALLGKEPQRATHEEVVARDILLAARNALHAVARRPTDVYEPELRSAAAAWLGLSVEALGSRLYRAVRVGESLADDRWPDLQDAVRPDPVAMSGRWVLRALRRKRPAGADHAAPLRLAVSAAESSRGKPFDSDQEAAIERASAPEWNDEDRALLVRLLAAGRNGQRAFERLHDLGWMDRALPHWTHVVAAPQMSPLHLHPVDTHLWRTVHELQAITGDDSTEPWCREVAEELGSLDEALLAALFHDIGKGLPGDHSIVGADVAKQVAGHIGLGPGTTDTLSRAVRHHLLLPSTATRRDLGDRQVIAEIAHAAGDLRMLQLLYLLSVADARATGPAVWNDWKSSLVRTAFLRAADVLGTRSRASGASADEAVDDIASALGGEISEEDVKHHIEQMPEGYVYRFEPEEIATHLRVVGSGVSNGTVRLEAEPGGSTTTLTVASVDRPGMLALVAGVLALHNLSVLDARVSTRADGVAIDSFSVVTTLDRDQPSAERWASVRADLEAAAAGRLDLTRLLDEKLRTYARPAAVASEGTVDIRVHGRGGTLIVEIRCDDRIGLLHDLAETLYELGHDVELAKVDTRGDRVVDVFYIREAGDIPASRVAELKAALEQSVTPA